MNVIKSISMLNILVQCVSIGSVHIDYRGDKHSIQVQRDQPCRFSELMSCFLFCSKRTKIFLTCVSSYLLKNNFLSCCVCVCMRDVTGNVWLVKLFHHNAKFSHLCNPNRHSINWLFRPASSRLPTLLPLDPRWGTMTLALEKWWKFKKPTTQVRWVKVHL